MKRQNVTKSHQSLSKILEDDEIIIDNPNDVKNLFEQYRTKDGELVTLFYKDKRVELVNAKKSFESSIKRIS